VNSAIAPSVEVDLAEYTRTTDGLYFRDVIEGEGDLAGPASRVTVAYRLLLANGTQVDSSTGVVVRLARDPIVEGWKLGIPGMPVGGARILVLPPELGYDWREVRDIPPNSILIFRIQLLRVQ
jgi:FKBP-type peptidyl-prolyl cis-trans isomerase